MSVASGPAADAASRYVSEARSAVARRDAETRTSVLIGRARLATFLPAAAALILAFSRGPIVPFAATGLGLLAVFAVLVVWHARVDERVAWFEALRTVHERGAARIARQWSALPAAELPAGVDLGAHPYALDLDLFGRASLFQWLGPAATAMGSETLAAWLLSAAAVEEIRARQAALEELALTDAWREGFAARGLLSSGARRAEIEQFLSWAEGPALFGTALRAVRAMVYVLVAAIVILLALYVTGVVDTGFWLIPVTIGLVPSFALGSRMQRAMDRASGGQQAMTRYAAIFEHAVHAPSAAPRLTGIQARLSADGAAAPECMRALNRILGFGELRRSAGIFHFPIQALTLWDFHVAFAMERWRTHAGRRVRGWIEAVGELDALASLATVQRDNPGWCVPVFGEAAEVRGRAVGHPLLPDARRVANDVAVGPPGTLLLITGSNMSGKSTMLRSIGLNVVLAHAGACVCAEALSLPACDLQTSIRVQDSLELGLSYFMAALARLKGVVDAAEHERPGRVLLYLLDEILQGTNSIERGLAVRAVSRHLLEAGAIGAMTTHDLALAAEEPLAGAAQLVHFTETVGENGEMRFDYKLRQGLATSRNALRLMKLIGIDL